ncbi:MAG: GNAT family N-acetyltransferase [Coriobacteriia bacterium]|nr:GNAT family N-acetyltransferase [Coriobacteriia bacterium]
MARRLIGLSIADRDHLPAQCSDCVFWESAEVLPRECGSACDARIAADWVRTVAAEWGECGRVAVEDGAFLGFIKYAPPGYLPQAWNMPSGPPLEGAPLIACMHLAPEARRHGLGGVLLRAALRDLAGRGERTVQTYALARRTDYENAPMVGVEFLLRNGFTVVRPHPEVPLLKLDLKSLVSWSDNLEAVLESLRIPVRVPKRAPATIASGGRRP